MSPKKKLVIHTALILILVISSAWIFVRLSGKILNSSSAIEDLEAKIRNLEEKRATVRKAAHILDSRETELARIKNFLVERGRPVRFVEDLEELALRTGNIISLGADEMNQPGSLVFRITLEGTEKSVFEYLKAVELLPYGVEVEDLSFQKVSLSTKTETGRPSTSKAQLLLTIKVAADL